MLPVSSTALACRPCCSFKHFAAEQQLRQGCMALVVVRRYLGSDAGRLLVTPRSAIQVLLCLHHIDLQRCRQHARPAGPVFLLLAAQSLTAASARPPARAPLSKCVALREPRSHRSRICLVNPCAMRRLNLKRGRSAGGPPGRRCWGEPSALLPALTLFPARRSCHPSSASS